MTAYDLREPGAAKAWAGFVNEKVMRAAKKGLLSAGHRMVSHIQTVVIPAFPHKPVDRGIYRAGWHARATEDGAVVENLTPHATFIEHGVKGENVKPGRKMIDALTEWVQRKGIGVARKSKVKGPSVARAKPSVLGLPGVAAVRSMVKKLTKVIKQKAQPQKQPGKKKVVLKKLGEKEARRIAWAIAMKMKQRGIFNEGEGLGVLKTAELEAPKFIREEVARELAKVAKGGK